MFGLVYRLAVLGMTFLSMDAVGLRAQWIQNLRDDINIGQKVMEELNITLPYGNENKLTTRTGNTVAMIKAITETETHSWRGRNRAKRAEPRERSKRRLPTPVKASKSMVLAPNTLTFVKCSRLKGTRVVEPLSEPEMQCPPIVYHNSRQVAILNLP